MTNQDQIREWQTRLEKTFGGDSGIIGERLLELEERERAIWKYLLGRFRGYVILMDSFFDFYIETIRNVAATRRTGWPEIAAVYTAIHVATFWRYRASYKIFWSGYFIDAFSLLRSAFENALQLGALAHGIIRVDEVFGKLRSADAEGMSNEEIRKHLRKYSIEADKAVRDSMIGESSGLSADAIDDLTCLLELLHSAVHKAKFNVLRLYGPWVRGEKSMPIFPIYDEDSASICMNASQGVAWMLVRTFPLLQLEAGEFSPEWQSRLSVIDDSFRFAVQRHPKRMMRSIEELLVQKFTFTKPTPRK